MKPNLEVVPNTLGTSAGTATSANATATASAAADVGVAEAAEPAKATEAADTITLPLHELPESNAVWQAHHALGMTRNPFPPTPDAQGYFYTERLSSDFAESLHCIRSRKGFVLITGEVGLGKSTFVRNLIDKLSDENTAVSLVLNTFLQGNALLTAINEDFGLHQELPVASVETNLVAQLSRLNAFLLESATAKRNCVLIIDDAQNLNHESLELVRLLCNVETGQEKLLQIVLVGQPELLDTLSEPSLRQLKSRVVKHVQLLGLTVSDVARYVDYRMLQSGLGANAGATDFKQIHLRPEAVTTLFSATLGNPRRLNLVMDRCLYGLVATRSRVVTSDLVRTGVAETTVDAVGQNALALGAVQRSAAGIQKNLFTLGRAIKQFFAPQAAAWMAIVIAVPALIVVGVSMSPDISNAGAKAVPNSGANVGSNAGPKVGPKASLQASAQPVAAYPTSLVMPAPTPLPTTTPALTTASAVQTKVSSPLALCAARLMQGTSADDRNAQPQPDQAFDSTQFLQNVYLQPISAAASSALMQRVNLLQQRNLACLLNQGDVPLLVWRKTPATELVRGVQPNAATQAAQRNLQQLALLPMGRVDGWFGPVTQDALKQFQAKYNLPRSGEPDALTILLLENFHG